MEFSVHTIETIQTLLFPIIKSLTKFDPQVFAGNQSDLFLSIGDALGDIASLFTVCGTALEDGVLSADELTAIIANASTVDEAIDEVFAHFKKEQAE